MIVISLAVPGLGFFGHEVNVSRWGFEGGTMLSVWRAAAIIAAVGLSGCATIVQGRSQDISVASSPSGAHCVLQREGRQVGVIEETPGSVTVRKTKDDILLSCTLAGYQPATQFLHSGIANGTYGNIIAGGLIGWGVDSATGADNEYPSAVSISFTK